VLTKIPPLAPQLFQEGDQLPSSLVEPHLLRGKWLEGLILDEAATPHLSRLGLAPTTKATHRRTIRFLSTLPSLFPGYIQADLPLFLVLVFSQLKEKRNWKWSTMVTKMASVQGCLALLPLYSRFLPPILLKNSPEWVQAMRGAGRNATQEIAKQSKPATWANIQEAMRREKNEKIKYAMLVAWMTCGRVGCVLQLRREDVRETEQGLAVQFRRGKSVLLRKTAYTVHTAQIPVEYRVAFHLFLSQQSGFLFLNVMGHQVKTALRRVDKNLEQRSIRRGALQTLAKVGKMTLERMLAFSGHSNIKMLQRYPDFGMYEPPELTSESAAAAARMVLPLFVSPMSPHSEVS